MLPFSSIFYISTFFIISKQTLTTHRLSLVSNSSQRAGSARRSSRSTDEVFLAIPAGIRVLVFICPCRTFTGAAISFISSKPVTALCFADIGCTDQKTDMGCNVLADYNCFTFRVLITPVLASSVTPIWSLVQQIFRVVEATVVLEKCIVAL